VSVRRKFWESHISLLLRRPSCYCYTVYKVLHGQGCVFCNIHYHVWTWAFRPWGDLGSCGLFPRCALQWRRRTSDSVVTHMRSASVYESRWIKQCSSHGIASKVRRSLKFRVFCDVAPCSLVGVDRRFRGAYCLSHQSRDDGGSTHI
jgi:hypothetical protein